MASSFFTLGAIHQCVLLGYWLDPKFRPPSLLGFAIARSSACRWQFAVQLPAWRSIGYRIFRPGLPWRRQADAILRLMGPSRRGPRAPLQVNVLVNS